MAISIEQYLIQFPEDSSSANSADSEQEEEAEGALAGF
jgi:hypothetical protein